MNSKKQKVKFEYLTVSTPQTLVLDDPASVSFYNVSNNAGDDIVINNVLRLASPITSASVPPNPNPTFINIQTNQGELDTTIYQVQFPTGTGTLLLIKKYYVDQ